MEMPGHQMPVTRMPRDSMREMRDSSARKMPSMEHQMVMPTDSGAHARHDSSSAPMPGMVMKHDSMSAKHKKVPTSRRKAETQKSNSRSKTASAKAKAKAPAHPSEHQGHMPGMQMPKDSTKKVKP